MRILNFYYFHFLYRNNRINITGKFLFYKPKGQRKKVSRCRLRLSTRQTLKVANLTSGTYWIGIRNIKLTSNIIANYYRY